jgi:hypothetical protein
MALNDAILSENLAALCGLMETEPMNKQDLADRLAAIIDAQIKTALVTVKAGIAVSTTGSASAQSGATTATGEGYIT